MNPKVVMLSNYEDVMKKASQKDKYYMIPLNAVSRVVKLLKTEWRLPGTEERVTWWGGGAGG